VVVVAAGARAGAQSGVTLTTALLPRFPFAVTTYASQRPIAKALNVVRNPPRVPVTSNFDRVVVAETVSFTCSCALKPEPLTVTGDLEPRLSRADVVAAREIAVKTAAPRTPTRIAILMPSGYPSRRNP